jgi:hypothetical protein
MSDDYTDEDGNPLGTWEPMTCDQREATVKEMGVLLIPFGGWAERHHTAPTRHVTDWGRRGAKTPEFRDDVTTGVSCTHQRFVLKEAVMTTDRPRCQVDTCVGSETAREAVWMLPVADRDGRGALIGWTWLLVCEAHADDDWRTGADPTSEEAPPCYRLTAVRVTPGAAS